MFFGRLEDEAYAEIEALADALAGPDVPGRVVHPAGRAVVQRTDDGRVQGDPGMILVEPEPHVRDTDPYELGQVAGLGEGRWVTVYR